MSVCERVNRRPGQGPDATHAKGRCRLREPQDKYFFLGHKRMQWKKTQMINGDRAVIRESENVSIALDHLEM